MIVPLLTPEGEQYVPRPTQRLFHASGAPAKAFLGGMGAGKSLTMLMEVLIQALEVKERGHLFKGLIARSTWEKLHSATWPMWLAIIPREIKRMPGYQEKLAPFPQVILPNGAWIRGMNLDDPEKFGSEQYSVQGIDECGEKGVAEEHFLWMVGRRRNPVGRNQILLAGHPRGQNWVWKYFFQHKVDPSVKRLTLGSGEVLCDGFQVSSEEAAAFYDPSYLGMMRAIYPPEWIERYLTGDFGVAEGQILDAFNPEIHMVPSFPIPQDWYRYRGVDHGLTHPTCCAWAATDFEGNRIYYREHSKKNLTPAENVQIIHAMSQGDPEVQWDVIDPSTEQRQTAGGVIQSLVSQYRDAGFFPRLGNNDLAASIMRLKYLLRPDPEHLFPHWHPRKGLPGSPRLFLTSACPRLRWEMENWCWLDIKPGQVDRQKVRAVDDDLIACMRYIEMGMPREAEAVIPMTPGERIEEILAELKVEREGEPSGWIGAERIR